MSKLIFYLLLAFNIWMIIDAVRRRAEFFWFIILVLFGPMGSLLYFFVVKAKDYKFGPRRSNVSPRIAESIDTRGEEVPTSERLRLELGDSLEQAGRHEEALAIFKGVLQKEPNHVRALHGQARSELGLGQADKAVQSLERVMELDRGYRDFAAALDYAEALSQAGRNSDAVDLLRGLNSVSAKLNHQVALAHYLQLEGQTGEARQTLEQALDAYDVLAARQKERAARWASRAKEMLEELDARAKLH